MKKMIWLVLPIVPQMLFGAGLLQSMDLTGTWVGTTYISDRQVDDSMTLVLEKTDGCYAGTVTDSMGLAELAEIRNVIFENETLTFDFTVFDGEQYMNVHVTLKMEGEFLAGNWEAESGTVGEIRLEKKM